MSFVNGLIISMCYSLYLLWILFFLCSSQVSGKNTVQRIYSAGKTVFLEVRENISVLKSDDVQWFFGNTSRLNKGRNVQKKNKFDVFENGTLKICDGKKAESGQYVLTIYNKSGEKKAKQTTTITFLEMVSKLSVRSCAKNGRIRVTCSIGGGDDVQVIWTWQVNGTTESMEVPLLTSNEHTIFFNNAIPDSLTCKVFNAISKKEISARESLICRGYMSTLAAFGLFLTISLSLLSMVRDVTQTNKAVADENVYLEMHSRVMPQHSGITRMESSVYEFCRSLHHSSSQTMTISTKEDAQADVYVPMKLGTSPESSGTAEPSGDRAAMMTASEDDSGLRSEQTSNPGHIPLSLSPISLHK